MAIDECPSISDTIFGFTLRVSSSVAHVFRRSWKRFSGSPARFSSGLNFSFVTLEGAVVGVHVVPLQPEQLSLTEAGVYRQHVEGFESVPGLMRCLEQELGLLRRERVHLFAGRLRWLHGLGGIPGYQAVHNRLLEGLVKRGVDVAYRAGRRSRLQLLPVESAHVGRREGLQLYTPECGLQV